MCNYSFLDVIWPSNLIQGQSVYDIGLSSVPLGIMRKPGTIFLAVVSGKNVNYSRNIESFTASNINQAMNDIMAEHGFQDLPAYINYTMYDISCEEEIAYKMDMDMKTFKRLVGDSFSNKDWQSRKTRKIVSLDQELFTMVYEFNGMNEVFKDDMDTEYLAPYTYEGNPMCWFYGFKLHFACNEHGEILSFYLSPGNMDDRNLDIFEVLKKKLFGKLYTDKGYISTKLFESLFNQGIHIVTGLKSNMKNRLMNMIDKLLLRKRSIIETINDQLKNICDIEHSRHRSIHNFVMNLIGAIGAY